MMLRGVSTETFKDDNPTSPDLAESVRTYSYDATGKLEKVAFQGAHLLTYERYEYYANGNVSKTYSRRNNDPEYLHYEYLTYDDKPTTHAATPFLQELTLGFNSLISIHTALDPIRSKNNCLTLKQYSEDGSFRDYSFSYTYNELGYPTQIQQGQMTTTLTLECK